MRTPTLLALLLAACGTDPAEKATTDAEVMPGDLEDDETGQVDDTDSGNTLPTAACGIGTPVGELTTAGCVSEAACTWSGDAAYDYLGYSADGGHDFDGDGVEDIVVGALFADATPGSELLYDAGRVLVLSGADLSAGGPGVVSHFPGQSAGEQSGAAVSLVGDLDGDGDSEMLVGARGYSDALSAGLGAVHLVMGGPPDGSGQLSAAATWTGSQLYGRGGHAVLGPGDLDGDGVPELAVSGNLWETMGSEDTEVFSRGRTFLASGASVPGSGVLNDFPVHLDGTGISDQAGAALAAGDLDGDGHRDLVVGAPYGGSSRGRVHIVPGGPELLETGAVTLDVVSSRWLDGAAAGDAFGWAIAVGEVTGDGVADLVVGAPLHDAPWDAEGQVVVYEGGTSMESAFASVTGEFDDHQLGTGLIAGADLNGDGQGDVMVGAVAAWHELRPKSGRSYLLSGGADLAAITDVSLVPQIHAQRTKDYLGRAAAVSDVDSDGRADLLVSSAYANPDGQTDAGSAWLFFGQ